MQLRRLTLLFAVSALALAGCSDPAPSWKGGGGGGSSAAAGTVKVTSPTDGAKDVSTATSIVYEASSGAADATVELKDADGTTITGAAPPAGGSASPSAGPAVEWMPGKQLKYATEYTATVTAGGAKSMVKFTTM